MNYLKEHALWAVNILLVVLFVIGVGFLLHEPANAAEPTASMNDAFREGTPKKQEHLRRYMFELMDKESAKIRSTLPMEVEPGITLVEVYFNGETSILAYGAVVSQDKMDYMKNNYRTFKNSVISKACFDDIESAEMMYEHLRLTLVYLFTSQEDIEQRVVVSINRDSCLGAI